MKELINLRNHDLQIGEVASILLSNDFYTIEHLWYEFFVYCTTREDLFRSIGYLIYLGEVVSIKQDMVRENGK